MDGQIRPVRNVPACSVPARTLVPRTKQPGIIMHMTANRLILLLQIYRDGVASGEKRIGTFETDLRMLLLAGLIRITTDTTYDTTERGDVYVRRILETEL